MIITVIVIAIIIITSPTHSHVTGPGGCCIGVMSVLYVQYYADDKPTKPSNVLYAAIKLLSLMVPPLPSLFSLACIPVSLVQSS